MTSQNHNHLPDDLNQVDLGPGAPPAELFSPAAPTGEQPGATAPENGNTGVFQVPDFLQNPEETGPQTPGGNEVDYSAYAWPEPGDADDGPLSNLRGTGEAAGQQLPVLDDLDNQGIYFRPGPVTPRASQGPDPARPYDPNDEAYRTQPGLPSRGEVRPSSDPRDPHSLVYRARANNTDAGRTGIFPRITDETAPSGADQGDDVFDQFDGQGAPAGTDSGDTGELNIPAFLRANTDPSQGAPDPNAQDPNMPFGAPLPPAVPTGPQAPAPVPRRRHARRPSAQPAHPAPAPTTPPEATRPQSRDERLNSLLQEAETAAAAGSETVADVLTRNKVNARTKYSKELARVSGSVFTGNKKLEAAQQEYADAVDAEAIAAIPDVLAQKPAGISDEDWIRECSVLGNLGFENAGTQYAGEEGELISAVHLATLERAGYDIEYATTQIGSEQVRTLYQVRGEPTGYKRLELAVTRAWDAMGQTRTRRILRGGIMGVATAGVTVATGGLGGAVAGIGLMAAGTRAAKASFAVYAEMNGNPALVADQNMVQHRDDVIRRRNAQTVYGSYNEALQAHTSSTQADRAHNRKLAGKTAAITALGTLGTLGLEALQEWWSGPSSAPDHGGSQPSGKPDASTPKPAQTSGATPHPSSTPSASPSEGTGSGAGQGAGAGHDTQPGTGGSHDTNPGNGSGAGHENGSDQAPHGKEVKVGKTGTIYGDFDQAGIKFEDVANAANKLAAEHKITIHHPQPGNPNVFYYGGGSRAEIMNAIMKQMEEDGAIDGDDFHLAA